MYTTIPDRRAGRCAPLAPQNLLAAWLSRFETRIGIDREARDRNNLRLTFGAIIAIGLACSVYASLFNRGLYHDGMYYLVRIAQTKWFVFPEPARIAVDFLRQSPVVLLTNLVDLPLLEIGRTFSLVLQTLPLALAGICWFVIPPERKALAVFPLIYLLTGYAPTSMLAIGEAAPAVGYLWILFFLLLFHTRTSASQALFLALCLPVFILQEGTIFLVGILLFAVVLRWSETSSRQERVFLAISSTLLTSIILYQARWIVFPAYSVDRDQVVHELGHFIFLYTENHLNLPLVTGSLALIAVTTIFFVSVGLASRQAARLGWRIATGWLLFACLAIVATMFSDNALAPPAQTAARYQPVFISAALCFAIVPLVRFPGTDGIWARPSILCILLTLCAVQSTADIMATRRWHAFTDDLQSRLNEKRGLISWESTTTTGNKRVDADWELMATGWLVPVASIVFAPNGRVQSIINWPSGTHIPEAGNVWWDAETAIDPRKIDALPELPQINYGPYRAFMSSKRADAR
jgi:hypothetical protein